MLRDFSRFLLVQFLCFLGCFFMLVSSANSSDNRISAYDFSFNAIDGTSLELASFTGRPLLIVNTASECGFTPQYEALQMLHERYADKGLVIIGVPSNDFGRQETGTNEEIAEFCEVNFGITFLLADKVKVKGDEAHPFYLWAKEQAGFAGRPRWNFHKYLIDRNGHISDWFSAMTSPDSSKMTKAIEATL